MNSFFNENSQLIAAIAWTMLHSLWQFGLIAFCVQIGIKRVNQGNAHLRSLIYTMAMACCLLLSAWTFYDYLQIPEIAKHDVESIALQSVPTTLVEYMLIQPAQTFMQTYMAWIVLLWGLGCSVIILKLVFETLYCQRLKSNKTQVVSPEWQARFLELKLQLGVQQKVLLRWSQAVSVPCVIGYIKPVILVPSSVVLGLSPVQIEMILLHELAHIRRNEALMNTLQMLLKTLFFFNPATYYLSSKADQEREHACDDIAVQASGNPLLYAQTLQSFAAMNLSFSPTAALLERKFMLKQRVQRLFANETVMKQSVKKTVALFTSIALSLTVVGCSMLQNNLDANSTVNTALNLNGMGVRYEVSIKKNGVMEAQPVLISEFNQESSFELDKQVRVVNYTRTPIGQEAEVMSRIYTYDGEKWLLGWQPSMKAAITKTPSFEFTSDDKVYRVVIKPRLTKLPDSTKKKT
jgi:beta-lactamase regulating signal transducer with metallopeptidase domain